MNDSNRARNRFSNVAVSEMWAVVLPATATLLFLQGYRVFVPYLIFKIDQSQRQQLAAIGIAVFGLAFLGALLYRFAGGRIALWTAVATMSIARLGIQFSGNPDLRWLLGAATIVGWSWALIVLLPRSGEQISIGIGFALALDILIRGLRGSLDLPWMPDIVAHAVTIVIVIAMIAAVWLLSHRIDSTNPSLHSHRVSVMPVSDRVSHSGSWRQEISDSPATPARCVCPFRSY